MKVIFTILLSVFGALQLSAQCVAYAGSPQSLHIVRCVGQSFDVSTLGDEVLAASGDSLVFVVHDGAALTLGNVLAVNSSAGIPPATGHFDWSPAYQSGVTYQITAFAGLTSSGLGPIGIDLNDPCLSVSPVGTVVYNPLPPVLCTFNPLTITCSQPVVTITDPFLCAGNNPAYAWSWSGPNGFTSSSPTPSVSIAGTYSATITNGTSGCSASFTLSVSGSADTPIADAGNNQVLTCVNNFLLLDGSNSTFAVSWEWTGPNWLLSNSQILTVDIPGDYCLTVTSATGCTATDCMTVAEDINFPSMDAGPDLQMCSGGSVQLSPFGPVTANFIYQWSPATGLSNANTAAPIASPFVNTNYTLTVTDIASGCTASDDMWVTVWAMPIFADAGPDMTLFCNGDLVQLDGSNSILDPGASFQWSCTNCEPDTFFNQLLTPSVNVVGTYCLTIMEPTTGCVSTDCMEVTADDFQNYGLGLKYNALPCDGGSTWTTLANDVFFSSPNFEFSWSTPNGNIISSLDSIAIEVDQAGMYCVTISDSNSGCTMSHCDTVYEKIHVSCTPNSFICAGWVNTYLIEVDRNVNMQTYNLFVEVNDSLLILEYDLNYINYTFSLAIEETSVLKIWAEDTSGGCVSDTLFTTADVTELPSYYTVQENGCDPVRVTAVIDNPVSQLIQFSYEWLNDESTIISDSSWVSVTETGWYYLTINGICEWQDSIFVPVNFSDICATIEGNIQKDFLDDCQATPDETALANWLVQAVGMDTFYATTDTAGFYSMPVEPGDYTISVFPPTAFWEPCGNDFPASVPNPDEVATINFIIKKLPGCPELTVDIIASLLRRCMGGNYFVNYCNQGVETATDAYLDIHFDPFLTFNTASLPATDLSNNTYRFQVGDLEPGECGAFWIAVNVSCDAVLGQTHCTEAHIFPDSTCLPPNPLWTGASLQIQAECTDSLRFTVINTGTAPASLPLGFVVIEDAVMYMETPPPGPTLDVAQEFVLAVAANGSTWRMEVEQEPYHPYSALPVAIVEGCGTNFSTGFVNQFPLGDNPPFLDEDCTQNIASYDPNDKQGFPTGYGETHAIEPGTELQYLVRFQNTGTDTAFNVVIRDTLSAWLDVTSVRPGAASHPYQFEIYAQGVVKFTFPDILLPDSSANQAGSNGFVHFSVKPRPDAPLQSVIENTAAIYFDFNEPVLTNTVFHTLDTGFVEQPLPADIVISDVLCRMSPNPFEGSLRVEVAGVNSGKILIFKVLDPLGRVLREEYFEAPGFVLDGKSLAAGIYFYKIENEGSVVATGKMVRE